MRTPAWVVRLLAAVVPPDRHDDVLGDLEEIHRRRLARWGPVGAGVGTGAEGLAAATSWAARRAARGLAALVTSADVRLAVRLLWRSPVMTVTSIASLALGIGIAAAGFSLIDQVFFGNVPFPGGDRWVVVESYDRETGSRVGLDLDHVEAIRSSVPAVEHVAAAAAADVNLVHPDGRLEPVAGARVTPGIFAYLPYRPLVGRLPRLGDGREGTEPVVLLRERLWHRLHGGSPDAVGNVLDIGGTDHRIVGVLPDHATFPDGGDVWVVLDEATLGAPPSGGRIAGTRAVAVLAPGVDAAAAEGQINQVSERLTAPGRGMAPLRHRVTPLPETIRSAGTGLAMGAMMVTLLSVLLVIAANVGNLVVARTARRSGELAVRMALGGSRIRVVGQLFLEALVLGAVAAVPGLLGAGALLRVYDRLLDELPFWMELRVDAGTAAVVAGLTLLASAVIGIVPALRATGRDTAGVLRAAGRGGGVGRIGGAMILVEVALSVALLGYAAMFAQGYRAYLEPAFALPEDRVLTARLQVAPFPSAATGEGDVGTDSLRTLNRAVEEALGRLAGVSRVGLASHLPRTSPYPLPLELEGRGEVLSAPVVAQGGGLFELLEVEPLRGRTVEPRDLEPGAAPVAVVNAAFARAHFGGLEVTGRRLRLVTDDGGAPAPWREIVGVVPDVMEVAGPADAAGVYVPLEPGRRFSVALQVDADPASRAGDLRRALFDLDPAIHVSEVVRLEDVGAENRRALGILSSVMVGVGIVTLLLSLAGVYAIVSLSVTQRTREVGIRMALGGERGAILWALLRRSTVLVVGGAVLGAGLGALGARVRLFVFAVPDGGPWLFPSLVGIMAIAGALACWVPARRALGVLPVEALREE